MMGFGFGGFGLLVMLLFWGVIIALAVWIVSSFFPRTSDATLRVPGSEAQATGEAPAASAIEIAGQRYARGEISREEYEEIVGTLRDERSPDVWAEHGVAR